MQNQFHATARKRDSSYSVSFTLKTLDLVIKNSLFFFCSFPCIATVKMIKIQIGSTKCRRINMCGLNYDVMKNLCGLNFLSSYAVSNTHLFIHKNVNCFPKKNLIQFQMTNKMKNKFRWLSIYMVWNLCQIFRRLNNSNPAGDQCKLLRVNGHTQKKKKTV